MSAKIAFVAADIPAAQQARRKLARRYGQTSPARADIVVALGGDGFMLETVHAVLGRNVPIYGMNLGSVGFLMNEYAADGLPERLAAAVPTRIHPLTMTAQAPGGSITAIAFNEVSLLRQTRQAAKIRITLDDKTRLQELICDGLLVATP